MSLLQKTLANVAGNRFVQRALEVNVEVAQFLMGIGSASRVLTSGERIVLDLLKRRHQPPYCVFDVGSNRGQFLQVVLNALLTDEFSVHCFEPGRDAFRMLAERSPQNPRIRLNNLGVGNARGEAVLHYDAPASALASLTKRRLDHFGRTFTSSEIVELDTIDAYCSDNVIQRIHLLKLDIEGHELDALAGASRMFAKGAIDIVSFEFGGSNIDTRSFFQDFWYFFEGVRMKLFRITPSGFLRPLSEYRESYEQFRTTAFVALRSE
jgi:FkbM family methyltransferase